jgi:DNA-binding Lrp family transcriptional regulator
MNLIYWIGGSSFLNSFHQRNNKQISAELGVPLTTIQRRTRNIIENGIMNIKIEPNFKRLGIKRGLLHIYLTMRLQ